MKTGLPTYHMADMELRGEATQCWLALWWAGCVLSTLRSLEKSLVFAVESFTHFWNVLHANRVIPGLMQ